MRSRISIMVALLTLPVFISCRPPVLNNTQPNPVFPRQVVAVDGSELLLASVRWDAGLGSERGALRSFLSARYFQVPGNATAGIHPVQLRNNAGTSAVVNVTVSSLSGGWPAPRIDDIGITALSDNRNGTADVWLAVPAANVDPDATVRVDAVNRTSIFYSAIPHAYFNAHTASTYGYPVYHYGMLVVFLDDQPFGGNLNVEVTNTDGQAGTRSYQLPADAASLDSDNDGLLDSWETSGYTAPSGAVINLAAMGCNPRRKDILVEVDWISAATPNATIWAPIESTFASAPVLNPDGSQGVFIHIDRGQGGAFTGGGTVLTDHTTMDFGAGTAVGYVNFYTYKAGNFDADRLNIFHYCVFGRAMPGGSSGRGEIWGNDFIVTFANFGVWGTDLAEVGTFIHELGHNLALRHGGIDNAAADANQTHKPNQESTMNYRYQFGGISNDCDFASENVHTYSMGMYRTIVEANVNENAGICDNAALDFNANGAFTNGSAVDTDQDGDRTDVNNNYNEWGRIMLAFTRAGSRWNNN